MDEDVLSVGNLHMFNKLTALRALFLVGQRTYVEVVVASWSLTLFSYYSTTFWLKEVLLTSDFSRKGMPSFQARISVTSELLIEFVLFLAVTGNLKHVTD